MAESAITSLDIESEEPFHSSLTRKLIQSALTTTTTGVVANQNGQLPANNNNKNGRRLTSEAVVAASEVLRLFVQEARHRAGILAECEHEGRCQDNDDDNNDDDDDDNSASAAPPKVKGPVVGADHIARIAAELLMDFS